MNSDRTLNSKHGKTSAKRRHRSSSSDSCSSDKDKVTQHKKKKTKVLMKQTKRRNTTKHKYKKGKSRSSSSDSSTSEDSSTSSSSDSSSSSSSEKEKRNKKKKHKLNKLKNKTDKIGPVAVVKKSTDESTSNDIPMALMEQRKSLAPMTKEEWEKRQSVVRRVYDETTGRHRLIKGDGEVIEEIVSKERHKEINKQATKGDGEYFQSQLKKM